MIPVPVLSKREQFVLQSIINGKRLKDIAIECGVRNSTIATYKHRVAEKLGTTNVIEMAKWYTKVTSLPEGQVMVPIRQQATDSCIVLFGSHNLDMLQNAQRNPKTWRRLIMEKFANEVDFSNENVAHLTHILEWINEIQKSYE